MSSPLEYHISVRHSIPASVVLFSLLIVTVLFVSSAHAQFNAPPTSVVSPPLVGRSVNPPTSAISQHSHGYTSNPGVTPAPFAHRNGDGDHRRHRGEYGASVYYAVPVPYAVDTGATENDVDDSADDNYQGGPTIFDRRGYGPGSYIPPVRDIPSPHSALAANASVADSDPPQQPTVLVFKDRHKLEVGNYAIVGQTLFDLTPGHARKIALADLDLEATRQQNEDRGATFQLPATSQGN